MLAAARRSASASSGASRGERGGERAAARHGASRCADLDAVEAARELAQGGVAARAAPRRRCRRPCGAASSDTSALACSVAAVCSMSSRGMRLIAPRSSPVVPCHASGPVTIGRSMPPRFAASIGFRVARVGVAHHARPGVARQDARAAARPSCPCRRRRRPCRRAGSCRCRRRRRGGSSPSSPPTPR